MIRPNLIALLTLLATGPLAAACSPSFCRPLAVKKVDVLAPAAVLVATVPLYGSGYAPPQQAQQPTTDPEVLKVLQAQTQAIRELTETVRLLMQLQGKQPAVPPPAAVELSGKELFEKKGKCVNCHRFDNADAKGRGFVLAELGNNLPKAGFGPNEERIISRQLDLHKMPPAATGVTLTDAEIARIKGYLFPKKED